MMRPAPRHGLFFRLIGEGGCVRGCWCAVGLVDGGCVMMASRS